MADPITLELTKKVAKKKATEEVQNLSQMQGPAAPGSSPFQVENSQFGAKLDQVQSSSSTDLMLKMVEDMDISSSSKPNAIAADSITVEFSNKEVPDVAMDTTKNSVLGFFEEVNQSDIGMEKVMTELFSSGKPLKMGDVLKLQVYVQQYSFNLEMLTKFAETARSSVDRTMQMQV